MRHPWNVTLRQFLERAQSDGRLRFKSADLHGPRGATSYDYADLEKLGRTIALALGCDLDDLLAPTVLRSLCAQFSVPEDDFRLDPDPDAN